MKSAITFLFVIQTACALWIGEALQTLLGNTAGELLDALEDKGINIPAIALAQEVCSGPGLAVLDPPVTPIPTFDYVVNNASTNCLITTGGKTALNYHYPLYERIACGPTQPPLVLPGQPCQIQYFIYDDGTSSVAPIQLSVVGELTAAFFLAHLAKITDGEFMGRNSVTIFLESPAQRAAQTAQCFLGGISYTPSRVIEIIY